MSANRAASWNSADRPGLSADIKPTGKTLLSLTFKRCLDLVFSLMIMVVALPVLLLACAAIKLDSPGPVLYRQWRGGRDGKPFQIIKLRTMVDGADGLGPAHTQRADPRITQIGSVLRRWSIDEIPQLLNVLAGQMSLVGPRPNLVADVARYTCRQQGVLRARPGITGWGQVNGRGSLDLADKLELDLEYVMNRTMLRDLTILVRTVRAVQNGRGAKLMMSLSPTFSRRAISRARGSQAPVSPLPSRASRVTSRSSGAVVAARPRSFPPAGSATSSSAEPPAYDSGRHPQAWAMHSQITLRCTEDGTIGEVAGSLAGAAATPMNRVGGQDSKVCNHTVVDFM